jgi:hypothetical protein
MKFEFKKFLYVINDITNVLLKKETNETNFKLEELHKSFKIVSIFLIISLIINLMLLTKIFIYG